jgi:hypothetical protein
MMKSPIWWTRMRSPADAGPARPDLGRRLRVLSGVDEDLLSWVPTERARYTGMGGVVLGTALIAAFSMWFALSEVLGGPSGWLLLPVLVWALFVLNLDRWLVASSAGSRWQRRLTMLLPRLAVAVVLGVVVAEPIVLRVFQSAVEKHIQDGRDRQTDDLRTRLAACNPTPAADGTVPVDPGGCQGYLLTFRSTPDAVVRELAQLRADAATLRKTVEADSQGAADLAEKARRECAGDHGPGLTGVRGNGPECGLLRRQAAEFAAAHPVAGNRDRLADQERRIAALESTADTSRGGYLAERSRLIDRRVAALASHQGAIGLLERFRALHELVGQDLFLQVALWVIRIFFILVDCLPVLVKLFGGTTAYDRLVDLKIDSATRVFTDSTRTAERSVTADLEVRRRESESDLRQRTEELDLADQQHRAALDARSAAAIDERAAQILRQSTGRDAAGPSRVNGHRAGVGVPTTDLTS